MAHSVHVILQMAFPIIRKHDASQFSVSSEVESSVRGKHKQTGNIPPADLILRYKRKHKLQFQVSKVRGHYTLV